METTPMDLARQFRSRLRTATAAVDESITTLLSTGDISVQDARDTCNALTPTGGQTCASLSDLGSLSYNYQRGAKMLSEVTGSLCVNNEFKVTDARKTFCAAKTQGCNFTPGCQLDGTKCVPATQPPCDPNIGAAEVGIRDSTTGAYDFPPESLATEEVRYVKTAGRGVLKPPGQFDAPGPANLKTSTLKNYTLDKPQIHSVLFGETKIFTNQVIPQDSGACKEDKASFLRNVQTNFPPVSSSVTFMGEEFEVANNLKKVAEGDMCVIADNGVSRHGHVYAKAEGVLECCAAVPAGQVTGHATDHIVCGDVKAACTTFPRITIAIPDILLEMECTSKQCPVAKRKGCASDEK